MVQKLHVVHTTVVTNPATWYYLIWGDTLYFAYFYICKFIFFTYKNYCLSALILQNLHHKTNNNINKNIIVINNN